MTSRIAAFFALLSCAGFAFGQMAPRETVSAKIGGKKVVIEYGRPSLKGRSFSDLVNKLPEDRIWRAGSEQVTTLMTEAPLSISGKMIPPGKYSVYVHCPENGSYALVLNKVLGQPLGQIWSAAPDNLKNEPWPHMHYQKEIGSSEVARIPMRSASAPSSVDLFTISLSPSSQGATLRMAWGAEAWSLDLASAMAEGSGSMPPPMPEGSHKQ